MLLLLGIAGPGLSGRRRLDWAAIADDPGSSWIGLVLIAAASFVVVLALVVLRRTLRASIETDDEPMPAKEGSRVTVVGYLAAAAVVGLTALLVYLLVRSAVDVPPGFTEHRSTRRGRPQIPRQPNLLSISGTAMLAALLAGAALALAVVVLRRRTKQITEGLDSDVEPTEQAALAEAVAAAEAELDSPGDDTRAAIIAAYLAMEGRLIAGGAARQVSDTPTDFLLRALATARVSRGAATRLTDLFREARFSTHPMPATAREDAARFLARVADDLAHDGNHRASSRG